MPGPLYQRICEYHTAFNWRSTSRPILLRAIGIGKSRTGERRQLYVMLAHLYYNNNILTLPTVPLHSTYRDYLVTRLSWQTPSTATRGYSASDNTATAACAHQHWARYLRALQGKYFAHYAKMGPKSDCQTRCADSQRSSLTKPTLIEITRSGTMVFSLLFRQSIHSPITVHYTV